MQKPFPLIKKAGLILGPLVFTLLYFIPLNLINKEADQMLAVAAWMIIWWITETVSISITALIPLVIFPLFKMMPIEDVASSYGSKIVFLFFGGFVMALALEKVNLHRRIALNIVKLTGTSPDRVILGFMIATAFLSMWISNTATTVVMLPIAMSVILLLTNDADGFTGKDKNFALSLMLGIAFSANVGGVATIIGTPPNTVIVGFMEKEYNVDISFLDWIKIGLPFSIILLIFIYILLVKIIYPSRLLKLHDSRSIIEEELNKLGKIKNIEIMVLIIFACTISLWIFRTYIDQVFHGIKLTDTGISLLAAFACFCLPYHFKNGKFILDWEDTIRLPWGILILFGGGLALASGLSGSGVIDHIGTIVSSYQSLSAFLISAVLIFIVLFMTELMSNVALVAVFAPVVAGVALGLDTELLHMLIPIAMASSCAFMLPMATPPNAIVFASGYIKVSEMAKAGIFLNLIAVFIILLFAKFLIPLVF